MQVEALEKLGKELKCPICWSLFKSAVQLSCNHCFCRACIQQSIATKKSCPVCKQPANKRDIRPAASVDQLIPLYAAMERTMGVQVFCSQPEKPAPPPEGAQQKGKGLAPIAEKEMENEVPVGADKKGRVKPNGKKAKGGGNASKLPDTNSENGGQNEVRNITEQGALLKDSEGAQKGTENLQIEKAKPKKKAGKKSSKKKAQLQKEELPALCESKASDQGTGNLQPFFWMGQQTATQDCEQATQFRPTPASPPIRFSDLLSSGRKVAEKPDVLKVGGRETRNRKKEVEKTESGQDKREEFYSCEDVTALDVSVQEDGLEIEEAPAPAETVAESGGEKNEKNKSEGRKKPEKKEKKGKKRGRKEKGAAEEEEAVLVEEPLTADAREKRLSDIRASVSAAIYSADIDAVKAGKKLLEEEYNRQQRAIAEERRTAVSVGETAVAAGETAFIAGNTAVTAGETAVVAGEALTRTPYTSKQSSFSALKTPAPQDFNTGLCPSSSRPLNPQTPVAPKNACGFCGLEGDADVAGKLVRMGSAPQGLLGEESFAAEPGVGPKRRRVQLSSVFVHEMCAQWAPNVFFEGEQLMNLDAELARSRHLKCHVCNKRGAALGCFLPRCRHSYHYACSRQLAGCRFDDEAFVMLCPDHASEKLPYEMEVKIPEDGKAADTERAAKEKSAAKKRKTNAEPSNTLKRPKLEPSVQAAGEFSKWQNAPGFKWVLTGSGLSSKEKDDLALFAFCSGAQVVKEWSPAVTHVITGVDEERRSKRTLKYLTAVLTGQWLVSPEWVTESLKLSKPAKEAAYEVYGDVQSESGGPKRGRLAARKGAPLLFGGIDFFLSGDWPGTPSKGDMAAVIAAGGGTVLARKPLPGQSAPHASVASKAPFKTVILYFGGSTAGSNEPPSAKSAASLTRQNEAYGIAGLAGEGSVVAHHRWLLDSASAFDLQDTSEY